MEKAQRGYELKTEAQDSTMITCQCAMPSCKHRKCSHSERRRRKQIILVGLISSRGEKKKGGGTLLRRTKSEIEQLFVDRPLKFTFGNSLKEGKTAILRGGRDVIPHEKTEREADALYDFLERARKVTSLSQAK
ncbi:unnamed protein product [Pocillopora meandrina]|uniref:SWIM-type domain-containing protein n=1 Tax=Pocillopora meandrina TaxID=46732 RepID=A0AAU9XT52_9CNID|nr:unnamed protein product [Pocillopora meandrina]